MERRAVREDFDDLMHAGKGYPVVMQNSKVSAIDGINGRDNTIGTNASKLENRHDRSREDDTGI